MRAVELLGFQLAIFQIVINYDIRSLFMIHFVWAYKSFYRFIVILVRNNKLLSRPFVVYFGKAFPLRRNININAYFCAELL